MMKNKMDILEKKEHLSNLFDFYESLLTSKQQEYFRYYYFDDLSLSEIANIYGVSRNAIYDVLQKTFSLLESYEEKLGLFKKYKQRQKLYEEYQNSVCKEVQTLIEKLKQIE
ncbi:MAG TPA: YlxM family DNA-binding protein [Bacilli bacterium]|nr:YlxM family DNA-binding protein [Bacilli bacterium]HQD92596.1 YlxM family DNA-binding protein [Bacilli bacterium]